MRASAEPDVTGRAGLRARGRRQHPAQLGDVHRVIRTEHGPVPLDLDGAGDREPGLRHVVSSLVEPDAQRGRPPRLEQDQGPPERQHLADIDRLAALKSTSRHEENLERGRRLVNACVASVCALCLFEPAHKVTAVAESGSKSGASASSSGAASGAGRTEPATDLARRVAAARLRSGLTQAQLAEASGVTDETISRIERGRYEPAVSTLFRLAEALEVSLDRLAGDPNRDGSNGSSRRKPRLSPVVRRLRARIDLLTPESQRALLAVAEQLPADPRSRSSSR